MLNILWPLLFLQVSAQQWTLFDGHTRRATREGSVRLVGILSSSGRVEVYHDGQWGTVCDDGWKLSEAQVVCRQLGFSGAISASLSQNPGSGPIWLDDVNCKGSESSLSDCSFKSWGVTDCTHKEDAEVVCDTGKNVSYDRQFSLDNSLALSDDLGALFDSEDGCDFNITVHDVSEEAELMFCVHSVIFHMFPELNVTQESKNLTMEVSETCHPHVSAFLRYLYTRRIDVSITSAQCLHQLAYMFGVKKLMEDVGRVFTLLIPEDNSFQTQVSMYRYGVHTGDLVLQENVLQYLSWNCEFLIVSAVWNSLSFSMMDALLSRSDLVVKDEAFLLDALESWIQYNGEAVSTEQQARLLNHIRFPMIPVDKLYQIQFTSSVLHNNHENLYLTGLLRGFQFNALAFSKIRKHVDNSTDEHLPRIYTRDGWSVFINATDVRYPYDRRYPYDHSYPYNNRNYGQNNRIQTLSTPVHSSVVLRDKTVQWQAQVFLSVQECSNYGISCDSVPVARFYKYNNQYNYMSTIRYNNRLILTCKNKNNVFHVQDFKNDIAVIPVNSSMALPNPCPDDYTYRFVVRPEYI
ncbi:galectin-3-binding protein A-like [Triplophysa rosa]|uniref:Galectin-3-binding protein A n=1 Tax=Triplophysa rosa TaxID=992332 RepID=A0A9W7T3Y5_TRIRA|nr:galectin-3-binding protein A-like [Triplophysa rosa]KAI7789488.1 galectin-3-binding protein A precursor [Triplophysa rosa]